MYQHLHKNQVLQMVDLWVGIMQEPGKEYFSTTISEAEFNKAIDYYKERAPLTKSVLDSITSKFVEAFSNIKDGEHISSQMFKDACLDNKYYRRLVPFNAKTFVYKGKVIFIVDYKQINNEQFL